MKKIILLVLTAILFIGVFTGCMGNGNQPKESAVESTSIPTDSESRIESVISSEEDGESKTESWESEESVEKESEDGESDSDLEYVDPITNGGEYGAK